MTEFLQFFQSADVTLSDKLLEVAYIVLGLIAVYAGIRNATDKTNPKRMGTAIFWIVCGMLFVVGKWVPTTVAGAMVVIMVIPAICRQISQISVVFRQTLDHGQRYFVLRGHGYTSRNGTRSGGIVQFTAKRQRPLLASAGTGPPSL